MAARTFRKDSVERGGQARQRGKKVEKSLFDVLARTTGLVARAIIVITYALRIIDIIPDR